jgi:hypothetical protein
MEIIKYNSLDGELIDTRMETVEVILPYHAKLIPMFVVCEVDDPEIDEIYAKTVEHFLGF